MYIQTNILILDMALDLILICSNSNIIILDVHNNNKKYILILSKGPIQGLDNSTITAEEYLPGFWYQEENF